MTRTMLKNVTRYWWLPMITGLLSVGLGIWCLASPDTSLPIMAYTFAVIISVVGFINSVFALLSIGSLSGWGFKLLIGVIEIICGVWLLLLPETAMVSAFIYGIGFYLVFVALNAVCEAILYYGDTKYWLAMLLSFIVCTLILAVIFLAGPLAGGIAVWLYIGIAFITFGIYRMLLSIKICQANKELSK
ncbi:MAG: DUF308 domain-containing protein [Muribaculaceae bacterium]|nr:DUF308 domain-containing protein [Muribaculaceae bacterium]